MSFGGRWVGKFSTGVGIVCSLECDYGIAIFSMKFRAYIRESNLTH